MNNFKLNGKKSTFKEREIPHIEFIKKVKLFCSDYFIECVDTTIENLNLTYEEKRTIRNSRSMNSLIERAKPDLLCVGFPNSCHIEAKTGKSFPALQFLHNLFLSMIGVNTIYAISNDIGEHGFLCCPEITNHINYIGINRKYKSKMDGNEIVIERENSEDTVEFYQSYFEKIGIDKSVIRVINDVGMSADPYLYLKDDFIKSCKNWEDVIVEFCGADY